jgi:hypothetical protein
MEKMILIPFEEYKLLQHQVSILDKFFKSTPEMVFTTYDGIYIGKLYVNEDAIEKTKEILIDAMNENTAIRLEKDSVKRLNFFKAMINIIKHLNEPKSN